MTLPGHIRIQIKSEVPVQVDGEPWIQQPGEVTVLKSALKVSEILFEFRQFKKKQRKT